MSDPAASPAIENVFTPEERTQLEAMYRRVAIVSSEDGAYEYVLKPAEKLQWRAFRATSSDVDRRDGAQETLVLSTVVACAYNGEKTLDAQEARVMLEKKLLQDWTGAADGADVFKLINKLNMGQGAARAK